MKAKDYIHDYKTALIGSVIPQKSSRYRTGLGRKIAGIQARSRKIGSEIVKKEFGMSDGSVLDYVIGGKDTKPFPVTVNLKIDPDLKETGLMIAGILGGALIISAVIR